MPAPELLLQMWELRQQVIRSSAFQRLYQPTDGCLWRNRYQQMHMVETYPFRCDAEGIGTDHSSLRQARVHFCVNMDFAIMPCTPFLPSTS